VLRAEGRIAGPWVDELRAACDVHSSCLDQVRLCLELEDISFADTAGIALLKDLLNRGVRLLRINAFVAEQLRDEGALDER
jgi:ABC-type transporter Mla MlaB component